MTDLQINKKNCSLRINNNQIDLQTPFVRQNTPHPRELKAKAHKLFSKGQNSLEDSDLQQQQQQLESSSVLIEAVNQNIGVVHESNSDQTATPTPPPAVVAGVDAEARVLETIVGNGAEEESSEPSGGDDDIDDVSVIIIFILLLFILS